MTAGGTGDQGDQDRLLDDLRAAVGAAHLLVAPDLKAGFELDWTRRFHGVALAVVRPGSTDEVVAVVSACNRAGVGIVPQGGNTGLVGGAVPRSGEVVLSLQRLSRPPVIDAEAGEAIADAGVTLAELHRAAAKASLDFGVDFAARDAATIGGMIATNAGGSRVLRYGTMRGQVLGLEAVLADGSVVRRMTGVRKDNTGYDLASLLAGSEGTLGVITQARLRLVPTASRKVVAVIAVERTDQALEIVAALRRRGAPLDAAELFYGDGLEIVLNHSRERPPFAVRHPAYLFIEISSNTDPMVDLEAVLDGRDDVLDVAVSEDSDGQSRLWQLRDGHAEAVASLGIPHKIDVAVPLGRLAAFEGRVRALIASVAPSAQTVIWGHAGDGNFHVNVLGLPPDDVTVDDAVLRLAVEMGGSISAEHGIGRAKTRWLPIDRSPADLAAMRAIKRALDPAGILNPGVLFERPAGTAADGQAQEAAAAGPAEPAAVNGAV
ncbi:MAG: hypothetical protein QOH61_1389 [Chloroflexota bacterium]|nr:hypothetical protein [Chloroflexota bacterium]